MAKPPQEEGVRYSQGADKPVGAAAATFSWEHPVPQTKFWDDLPYTVARNFLSFFDAAASDPPPSFRDDDAETNALSKTEKLHLLLKLFHDRLASKDRDAAAARQGQTFYEADYHAWDRTWLSIAGIQHELGDLVGQEETLRMVIARRRARSNLSHFHSLAGVLLATGRYEEAEREEAAVRDWLDGRLGRQSPQALGARRVVAEAVWRQGRREEGGRLMREVEGIVEGTGEDSPYAVYRDQQRDMTRELWERLRGGDGGDGSA